MAVSFSGDVVSPLRVEATVRPRGMVVGCLKQSYTLSQGSSRHG